MSTESCCSFVPLNAVWLNRSRAKPVTRTSRRRSTVFAEPVKTKMPSEVAGVAVTDRDPG